MTCECDNDLLSGYLDRELDEELRVEVRDHIERCDECSRRLREMASLSDRLAASRQVDLPERLWNRIAAARQAAAASESVRRPGRRSPGFRRLQQWTVAAAAVVAVALPWIWSLQRASVTVEERDRADQFEAPPGIALAKYVEEIRSGDEEAGDFLKMHRGRPISPDEMAEHASFRPWLPEELPPGFRVEKCYVLATGCGNAFKLDCVRGDERLTIFQQPADGPVLFEGELQSCVDIDGVEIRCFVVEDVKVLNWSSGGCCTMVVCPPGDVGIESTFCCLLKKQKEEQEQEQESDP